ncbi:MAG: hypothetical protein FWE11_09715 [Defluviitaleaceae bacterium]|nr:hypothetical protein [Defluviitaleaceae bacterium]
MGRAGRGGGGRGFGGGGGRMGGSRAGSGRGSTLGGLGSAGRAGRGMGTSLGGGAARPPVRPPARNPMGGGVGRGAPRRGAGFGAGMGVGMGMGMMAGGRRRRRMGWGGGWGWGPRWGRRRTVVVGGGPVMHGGGGGGCGCMGLLMMLVVLVFAFAIIGMIANLSVPNMGGGVQGFTNSAQVTRSTVRREALPRNAADSSVPLFVDNLNWIGNANTLNNGLRNFHDRTGVRPILYLTGDIDGSTSPTADQIRNFAERRYTELTGGNEAHVLLLFYENPRGERDMWVTVGHQARLVMDDEAREILMDYVDRFYYGTLEESEMFARAFDQASRRIMTVTRSAWIPVLVVAGILLILLLLFTWWKRKQEQKNLEQEQLERVLNQPLETIGNNHDDASRLAQDYEDPNS